MLFDYSRAVHTKDWGPYHNFEQNSQWRVDLCARLMWEALCVGWWVPILPGPVVKDTHCAKLHEWCQQLGDPWFWRWTLMAVCHLGTLGTFCGFCLFVWAFLSVCVRFVWIFMFFNCWTKVLTKWRNCYLLSGCSALTDHMVRGCGGSSLNCRCFSLVMLDSTDILL